MAIFRLFMMAAVRHLGFSKVWNFNFRSHSEAQYASSCQISRRLVEPFQRYCRFSIFQDGGRRYLGYWKFQIFNGWGAQEVRTASACQVLSKSLKPQLRYGDFSTFQDGGRSPSFGLSKVGNFNFRSHSEAQCASLYQISRRSVKLFRRYGRFSIFQDAVAAILDFGNFIFLAVGTPKRVELRLRAKCCRNHSNSGWDMSIFYFFKMAAVRHLGLVLHVLGPPTKSYLVVFVTMQNLVVIGAVILTVCKF